LLTIYKKSIQLQHAEERIEARITTEHSRTRLSPSFVRLLGVFRPNGTKVSGVEFANRWCIITGGLCGGSFTRLLGFREAVWEMPRIGLRPRFVEMHGISGKKGVMNGSMRSQEMEAL
jgi:hypothetical protein